MKPASWPLRLPIIRHLRALVLKAKIDAHYAFYESLGMLPINAESDYEIVRAIWDGQL